MNIIKLGRRFINKSFHNAKLSAKAIKPCYGPARLYVCLLIDFMTSATTWTTPELLIYMSSFGFLFFFGNYYSRLLFYYFAVVYVNVEFLIALSFLGEYLIIYWAAAHSKHHVIELTLPSFSMEACVLPHNHEPLDKPRIHTVASSWNNTIHIEVCARQKFDCFLKFENFIFNFELLCITCESSILLCCRFMLLMANKPYLYIYMQVPKYLLVNISLN